MSVETYWRESGLGELVGAFDRARSGEASVTPLPAVMTDLVRLHRLIREHRRMSVLEFGVGYSTVVLAHALAENEAEFSRLRPNGIALRPDDFRLFSVDASETWINSVRYRRELLHGRSSFTARSRPELIKANSPISMNDCPMWFRISSISTDRIPAMSPAQSTAWASAAGGVFRCPRTSC